MFARTLLALGCLVSSASAVGTMGAKASLDIAIIEQAKDTYFDALLALLNNVEIPDIESDDGEQHLKDNHLSVSQQASDVEFTASATNNEIRLVARHLTATFKSNDFRAQEWIFVAYGHVEVDLNDIDLGLGLVFDIQTLADGSVVPSFKSADILVDIDRSNLDIKISGNIWTDLASLLEPFIKGPVADLIQSTLVTVLEKAPTAVDTLIAGTDGRAAIPGFPGWTLDFQTPEPITVTDVALEVGLKGIMYDSFIGEDEWDVNFPDMPYKSTEHNAGLQVFLTTNSINSVAGSALEVADAAGWINSTLTVNGTAINTNCGELNYLFPGLSDKYGAETPVNLWFNLTKLGEVSTSQSTQEISFKGSFDFGVWVATADQGDVLAVEVGFDDIVFEASLTITNFTIGVAVKKFQVGSIAQIASEIGRISTVTMKTLINTGFKVVLPALNAFLSKLAIQFPDNILGIFTLSDLDLAYYDEYIYFGATPTFLPPTTVAVM